MCRLAAYQGPGISLEHFLFTPSHGLMEQSWSPREMQEARLNADGYGFGWFPEDGRPATYVHAMPIWTDPNLASLGRSLRCHQWLANVRSATRKMAVAEFNTMPFADHRFIFLHNGYVDNFAETLRPRLRRELEVEYDVGIQGNTDSEHLFALLRQCHDRHGGVPLEQALVRVLEILDDWLNGTRALLNFIIGDGQRLVALRHAVHNACPSLYFAETEQRYPGGKLVASEPLTDSPAWQPVPEHHLLIIEADGSHRLQPL